MDKILFIKHKKFQDVCIEVYLLDIINNNTGIKIYGDYWNMAFNGSFKIGHKKSKAIHEMNLENFMEEWEMFFYKKETKIDCLRYANWVNVNNSIFNKESLNG